MSLWQFQAAVLGVHDANTPADDQSVSAPSVDDLAAALQSSMVN